MQGKTATAAVGAGLWAVVLLGGCGGGGGELAGAEKPLPPDEGSPGYFDRVSSLERVSEDDALRGMLLLLDGEDPAETFVQRVDTLANRGVVSRRWSCRADRPLTRGKLAYMVHQACSVPGGVMLTLTGPSPRYCLRELQYREMMGSGSAMAPVSGMEFVAVLTRADTFRRTGRVPSIMEAAEGP